MAGSHDRQEPGVKQVIVIRRDLKMRRGKEIAQGAHASMAWLTSRLHHSGARLVDQPPDTLFMSGYFTAPEVAWVTGNFRKITCQVPGEDDIAKLKLAADEHGVLAYVITDSGLTEFGGTPTVTAIAIGPDLDSRVDEVTGKLALY